MRVHWGSTRVVLLAGSVAVKLPRPSTWRAFLNGLLGNMQEREFSKTGWPELCPVVWSEPSGLALVMRRAKPLSDAQWSQLDCAAWAARGAYTVPVEHKRDSFGWLDGRLVAVDYGN